MRTTDSGSRGRDFPALADAQRQAIMDVFNNDNPYFPGHCGFRVVDLRQGYARLEVENRTELSNPAGIMHGGAIISLADNLGGTATTANLKPGQTTATIESKTNFFAGIPVGDVAYAECTPLHRGRTTMVWQTRVTRGDGRLCALVTQTQLVLERGK